VLSVEGISSDSSLRTSLRDHLCAANSSKSFQMSYGSLCVSLFTITRSLTALSRPVTLHLQSLTFSCFLTPFFCTQPSLPTSACPPLLRFYTHCRFPSSWFLLSANSFSHTRTCYTVFRALPHTILTAPSFTQAHSVSVSC